jgi:hypothetical protein
MRPRLRHGARDRRAIRRAAPVLRGRLEVATSWRSVAPAAGLARAAKATSVPEPMATPMSAFLSAGASLTPSPVTGDHLAVSLERLDQASLCSGDTRAKTKTSCTIRRSSSELSVSRSRPACSGSAWASSGPNARPWSLRSLSRSARRRKDDERSHVGGAEPAVRLRVACPRPIGGDRRDSGGDRDDGPTTSVRRRL